MFTACQSENLRLARTVSQNFYWFHIFFKNNQLFLLGWRVLVALYDSHTVHVASSGVILLLLYACGTRSFHTCLRGMSWWRTLHWRTTLNAEEVGCRSHAWLLPTYVLCLVAGRCCWLLRSFCCHDAWGQTLSHTYTSWQEQWLILS